MTTFDSIEEFYAADPRRRHSGEADYGVRWRSPNGKHFPLYRVSFIRDTGEVYASPGDGGTVVLLGTAPVDQGGPTAVYYKTLDTMLDGWTTAVMAGESYDWVKARIARVPIDTIPNEVHGVRPEDDTAEDADDAVARMTQQAMEMGMKSTIEYLMRDEISGKGTGQPVWKLCGDCLSELVVAIVSENLVGERPLAENGDIVIRVTPEQCQNYGDDHE